MNYQFDWHYFLNLFIPTFTSFLICLITICSSNKRHKKDMLKQEKQYEQTLKLSKEQFTEEQKIRKEQERLSYLPYLSLIPKVIANESDGDMDKMDSEEFYRLPFKLVNDGLGPALSAHIVCLTKLPDHFEYKIKPLTPISMHYNSDNNYDVLGISMPNASNILKVGNTTNFELYWARYDNKDLVLPEKVACYWTIKIQFKDIQNRVYEQCHTFLASGLCQKIYQINSLEPKLIE